MPSPQAQETSSSSDFLAVTEEGAFFSTRPVLATFQGLSFPLSLLKH